MKKRLSILTLSILIISFCICIPLSAKTDTKDSLKGFPEFIQTIQKDWKIPGVAICIIKDGKVILSEGYGLRDVKNGLKVTQETTFAIGSSSKAFTTATMGILVDENKLEWDKPVREYLPTFKLMDPFATARMTPRDLVIHNSGLPRHDGIWFGSSATRDELFKRQAYLEPSCDFRTTYQYNNLMFMTAGYLVGQIAGTTWEGFTQERIFDPLGMENSNFSIEDSKKTPDFALPYKERDGKLVEIPFRNIDAVGPAGSINSNVVDMAKWVLLHLNKGKHGGKQIISAAALKVIHSPHIPIKMAEVEAMSHYKEMTAWMYGMGWMLSPYRGHLLIHHAGGIDGFSALVTFMPRENLGAVILTNLDGTLAQFIIALNIYDRLLGYEEVPWNKRFKALFSMMGAEEQKAKQEAEKDRKLNTSPSHPLEDYVGKYHHPGYGIFTIEKEGDSLKGKYNATDSVLRHYHYDVFIIFNGHLGEDLRLSFFSDPQGNIDRLSVKLEPSVKSIVFKKKQ